MSVLLDLVMHDQLPRAGAIIHKAVEESFATDRPKMRHMTHAEVKRRFDIALRIFKTLRGDKGWSLERIGDNLPAYVRNELDGVAWQPDTRSLWTPDAPSIVLA